MKMVYAAMAPAVWFPGFPAKPDSMICVKDVRARPAGCRAFRPGAMNDPIVLSADAERVKQRQPVLPTCYLRTEPACQAFRLRLSWSTASA